MILSWANSAVLVSARAWADSGFVITAPPVVFATDTLPPAVLSNAYKAQIAVSGAAPITLSVISGSLPAGLSLSGFEIAGVATTAGSSAFTVRATNAGGSVDQAYTLVVSAPPGDGWVRIPRVEELWVRVPRDS